MKNLLNAGVAYGGILLAVCVWIMAGPAVVAEPKMAFSDLPAAAQKIIKDHQGTGKLGDIKKTVEDGETTYEAEIIRDDETYSASVTADGKWYSIEIELTEAPKPVQTKAHELADKGTIDNVSKVLEEGALTYEVELTLNDRYHSYTIGPRGRVRSHSQEVKMAELPAPVQKTVKEQLGEGKPGDLYKVEEDGKVHFQIEATKAGKEFNFSVAPDGKFLGKDE